MYGDDNPGPDFRMACGLVFKAARGAAGLE